MRNQHPPTQKHVTFAIGFLTCALFMGVCANSESGIAFAHGIINAFGIEYDNSGSGLAAADVQAAIDEQDAFNSDVEARITTLEVEKNTTPCDPNGDGAVTPQEMWDYLDSLGVLTTEDVKSIELSIGNLESGIPDAIKNLVLDTPIELNKYNGLIIAAYGVPPCSVH